VSITLQQSPLIIADTRRSLEIPNNRIVFSAFPKKSTTNDPGGTSGKIRVPMKRNRKDARKTIRPNIFNRFLVD
jgi:hypothetical protein